MVKGVHSILPSAFSRYRTILSTFSRHSQLNGFHEISLPIIEDASLYIRSMADSDIVSQHQLYWLIGSANDKGGKSDGGEVLRPEGTASALNTLMHQSNYLQHPKVFYSGQMFRKENPQRGRMRQFTQFGIENVNDSWAIESDIDGILLLDRILRELTAMPFERLSTDKPMWTLEINTIGQAIDRARYKQSLTSFFEFKKSLLSVESQKKLECGNSFGILDSKHSQDIELLSSAPLLSSYLSTESLDRFEELLDALRTLNVHFTHNQWLVRGLDYYTDSVFEVKINHHQLPSNVLMNESSSNLESLSIVGGGRYDGLAQCLGYPTALPAFGWAAGIDRIASLDNSILRIFNNVDSLKKITKLNVVILQFSDTSIPFCMNIAEAIRLNVGIEVNICKAKASISKSLSAILSKYAPAFIIFLGEKEEKSGILTIKNVDTQVSHNLDLSSTIAFLQQEKNKNQINNYNESLEATSI